MRLNHLESFYLVAKHGGFSKAARAVPLKGQPAYHAHVQSLEKGLGTKLYEMIGKDFRLTPKGRALFEFAAPFFEEIDNVKSSLQEENEGTLTVASTQAVIIRDLVDIVRKFAQRYPKVDFALLNRPMHHILSLVEDGTADFGLFAHPPLQLEKEILCIEWKRGEFILVLSAGHPLNKTRRVEFEDIAQHPIITYEKGMWHREIIDGVFKERNLTPRVIMETTSAEIMKRYVAASMGVGIMSDMAFNPGDEKKLRMLRVGEYFGQVPCSFFMRKGKYLSPFAKDFIKMLFPDSEQKKGVGFSPLQENSQPLLIGSK